MKKLNTYIDFGKIALAVLLGLIGSMTELNVPALIFLSVALVTVCGAEAFLLYQRKRLYLRYEQYLNQLERAVQKAVRDSEAA